MRRLGRALGRTFFWSYERMTWQYDVIVALIVAFVLLTPRHWFHDQPRRAARVELVSQSAVSRTSIYRLGAGDLASGRQTVNVTPEIERRAHDVLSNSVGALKAGAFRVVRIEPKLANDGSVAYYDVTVQR